MNPDDPIAALNEVLSEMIDLVQELKQALRKVPESHGLHEELDQLSHDTRSWAERLVDEDSTLGVSPLSYIPSAAGRQPPNLWPGSVADEEVRLLLGQHLDQFALHVRAALSQQKDEAARGVLESIERELQAHIKALKTV